MSLIDQARIDMQNIINGEFSTELTITPTGIEPVIIRGLATRHSQNFNGEGLAVIADNIHCSFSEIKLNDLGIVTRDSNKELNILGWKVSFSDAIGTYEYNIAETMPDNTLGLIRVILNKR